MAAVLYLKRTGFDFYAPNLPASLALEFPPTVLLDLEILNVEEFYTQINTFVETNKIPPSPQGVIVLNAEVYFEKEIPADTPKDKEPELIDSFLSNVPFNTPNSKQFAVDKTQKLVATNGDLLDTLRIAFAKHNIMFSIAVPTFATGLDLETMGGLTADTAKAIAKRFESFKEKALIIVQDVPVTYSSSSDGKNKKPSKTNRIFILVGVFVMLLGVLVAVFLWTQQQNQIPPPDPQTTVTDIPTTIPVSAPPVASTSATPVATSSSTINSDDVENLRVQILNGSGVVGQADIIRRRLVQTGFSRIETGNAAGVNLPKTLIVFSKQVPANVRSKVVADVEELSRTQVATQETTQTTFDIIITTARPSPTTTP